MCGFITETFISSIGSSSCEHLYEAQNIPCLAKFSADFFFFLILKYLKNVKNVWNVIVYAPCLKEG